MPTSQDKNMTSAPKPRPKYYDLNLAHLPAAGLVSIVHRGSGAALFLVLPVLLYLLQSSLASEGEFLRVKKYFDAPMVKLIALGFVWLYAHHFFAGIRYLFLDIHMGISKEASRSSALAVFGAGVVATLAIGWGLW
jgi:succinate dehydrogenase / fumarate reductase cytochrome b subunit